VHARRAAQQDEVVMMGRMRTVPRDMHSNMTSKPIPGANLPCRRATRNTAVLHGTDPINRPEQKKGGVFAAEFRGGNVQKAATSAAGPLRNEQVGA